MKNLLTPCLLICAVFLVLPDMAPSERASDSAQGQTAATEVTLGAPTEVQLELLAQPPEISRELMETIRDKIECCANKPMPPLPVELGTESEEVVPKVPATQIGDVTGKAPEDFVFYTNNDLGAGAPTGYTSVVGEPCAGNNGRCVFQSGNWYASLSTDFGSTFSFVNPYTTFPEAAGGFCCDQIVIYDPSRDCLFWLLLYIYGGDYNNVLRLAVANSFSDIENQVWYYYDISGQTFGLTSGHWLDFPDLVLGANSLYLTSNYVWRNDLFVSGTLIARFSLDQLAAGSPISGGYLKVSDRYSFRASHGADTVMYWAAHNSTGSIRIYQWTEGSGTVYSYDRSVTTWNNAVRTAPGPDGRDWLGYADGRILGAYVTDAFEPGGAVGFMWSASQGGAFAYPYVHVARFRVSDMTLLNEPNVWNPSYAFAYPSVNINARGHLGAVVMVGGGTWYPTCGAIIWDDYTSWPAGGGTFYPPIMGTSGPYFNRSGDYVSTRPCHPYSNTWIGTSFSLQGGPNNENARPRFLWFGRERDIPRPEPQNLYAFNGYHEAVPLAWDPPSGHMPLNMPPEGHETSHGIESEPDGDEREEIDDSHGSKQTLLSYNVYRSSTPGGPYTLIANVDRQYYRDEPVTNGNTYYYVVTALYDIVEESGYSNESAGSPVFAGYYINSGWTSVRPTIDGLIEPAEWATAAVVDITTPGVSPPVTLYVMNDNGFLYLAVDDPGDIALDDWDQFGPYFDEDHDYEWPPSSPSGEGNFWVQYFTSGSVTEFRGIWGWWPGHIGIDTRILAAGVGEAISVASGHVQFEVVIDLATSELNAAPGDVIGWLIYSQAFPAGVFSGWWPQEHVLSPYQGGAWLIPATYGDLELSAAPDIAVTPGSFAFEVPQGGVTSDRMTIGNTASPPAGDLAWLITTHDVTMSLSSGENVPVSLRGESEWIGTAEVTNQFDWEGWRREAQNATRLSDVVGQIVGYQDGTAKGIGDILDFFPAPNPSAVGVTYDPDLDAVWVTDEFGAQLFLLDSHPPYGIISTLALPASVPGGPDDIAIVGDVLYITDYNGDLTNFDDVIYAVHKVTGTLIGTWELHGVGNPNPSDSIDLVVGITTMGIPGQFLVTNHSDPLVRLVELQPGGMWQTLGTALSPVHGPTSGIDWDPLVGGFWVTNIVGQPIYLTDLMFNPVGFFPTPGPVTTGITSLRNGTLWASDLNTGNIYVLEGLGAECAWLSHIPSLGVIPPGGIQYVDVVVDATGLAPATYECEMHIHSNDPDESPWIVPVKLFVLEPPDIEVSPSSLTFTLPEGGADSKTLTIHNVALPGALDLMWHIAEQEVTLVTMDGLQLPIEVLLTSQDVNRRENKRSARPPSADVAPEDFLQGERARVNTGQTLVDRTKLPDDSGLGPEAYNYVVAEVVLNDPGTLIFHGGFASAHYAGAEFGNTGDFSFMYGLDFGTDELVTIDVSTGAVTTIGPATPHGSEMWTGLAMDPTDGTMYASGTDIVNSSLYTVNLATGAVSRIGPITNAPAIIAIAVSPWGEMYGLDIVNDVLLRIDKTTGAGTVIGPVGFSANFSQGMDFDESDGTLYLAALNMDTGGELRIANIHTGHTALVGPLGNVSPGGGAEITGFGVATVGPDCPWLAYDPLAGVVPPRSSENVDVMVDATGLADGDYDCRLMVSSNDPDEPVVDVPIHLTVTEPGITGTVRDSVSGDPIVGATVEAWDSYPDGTPLTRDATGGSGEYGLSGLAPGMYDLRAHAAGYYPKMAQDVMSPSSGVDFDLAPIPSPFLTSTWCDFWSDNTTFEGFPVQDGDVVVAEDPDGVVCGIYTANTIGAYGLMHVYGDDPTTPGVDEGAESGDIISFRVNRCLGMPRGPDSPVWMDGVVRNVDLEGQCVAMQEIVLWEGWNLFSFYTDCPLCAPVCSVATVLEQIDGNYIIVRGFDQQGISHCQGNNGALTYDPSLPPAFSDLIYLYPGYGYWVKMTVDDTLRLTGARVDPHAELELDENWNLRGYLPEIEDSVAHALASIDGNYIIIRGFDQHGTLRCQRNDGALTYDPSLPPAFSDLVYLWPGFGYWMKMSTMDTLIYPVPLGGCRGGAVMASSEEEDEVRLTSEWVDCWGEATFGGIPVRVGDIVSVRDPDGVKCGEFAVRMEGYFGLLHVYGDDASTPKVDEGAEVGDELTFWVNGEEAKSRDGEKVIWGADGEVSRVDLVTVTCAELVDMPVPKVFSLTNIYPNPFSGDATIQYQLPKARYVTVSIYNIAGELVRTLVAEEEEPGYHRVIWDGRDRTNREVVPGVYFCRFEAHTGLATPDFTQTKKITLIK